MSRVSTPSQHGLPAASASGAAPPGAGESRGSGDAATSGGASVAVPSGASRPEGRTDAAIKPPLFDLSHIDLNARMKSREDIARLNPHRGHMAQLDYVVWHEPDFRRGVGLKIVRPDEFWVPGHFPSMALLPGVLMIETAAQLGSFLYNSRFTHVKVPVFIRIEDATFRSAVVPGDYLYILCQDVKFNAKRFISDVQGLVNGKPAFEARITGMSQSGVSPELT